MTAEETCGSTVISEKEKSIDQHIDESCQLSIRDLHRLTNNNEQRSTGVKAAHKKNLVKWILCFCLLFVTCVGVVLVLILSHGKESTATPMVAVTTTNTSGIPPSLSLNASDTSVTEESLEAPMPTTWPIDNQTSENSQLLNQEDQLSPSSSPAEMLDRQAETPIDDERLDLVPKGYHAKKGLGNRR